MSSDTEKAGFNAKAKDSVRLYLRWKSWEEKVYSVARMNASMKTARQSMKAALAKEGLETQK